MSLLIVAECNLSCLSLFVYVYCVCQLGYVRVRSGMSLNDGNTSKNGRRRTQTNVQNIYMKIVVAFTYLWIDHLLNLDFGVAACLSITMAAHW